MAKITFKGNDVQTAGTLPAVGDAVKDFKLVRQDLSEASLETFAGKKKVLNIFPSIDTGICAMSVKAFQSKLNSDDTVVLHVSLDLPFAQKRFCGAEGVENAETLSGFRSSFGEDFGVAMTDGPMAGLYSRAVVVVDADNKVLHAEQVPEIVQEPDYDAALKALG